MTIAIYPGSFDPFTYGHLDIIKSGSEIFDTVIVAVTYNIEKQSFLPIADRVELIKQCVKDIKNVSVETYDGLTVDFAKKKGASVMLRGLRNNADYEYENQLSQTNSALASDIKTVFLMTKPQYSFISSSAVREIVLNGGDITNFVPLPVKQYLQNYNV